MRRVTRWGLLAGLLLCVPFAQARGQDLHDTVAVIKVSQLPPQARATLQLVERGGPFPYARDGAVFGNYERLLPPHPNGYYHEYTVETPGARNRGARRIVCGIVPARGRPMVSPLLRSDPFALPECYYSDDHYRTFKRIEEHGG